MGELFLFVTIVTFIVMIVDVVLPDQQQLILERLNSLQYYNSTTRDRQKKESLLRRIYQMTEDFVLKYFEDQVKKGGKLAPLEIKLMQADLTEVEPIQHRAKKFIYAFTAVTICILIGNVTLAIILGVVGYFAPDYFLNKKIEARQYHIKNEIPDFMDLLAAVFPASKGLEDAIEKVCQKSNGILAKEFEKTLEQIKNGRRKKEALQSFAQRCGIREVETLVAQIIQSEIFGTGLQDTLSIQAKKLRSMKKIVAEIKANKAKVTLLLPSLFLLVTIIIAITGPSVIQFIDAMGAI